MSNGPIGAELAQQPKDPSFIESLGGAIRGAVSNFFEISSEDPGRTALGLRLLGGLAMISGAVELAVGSQSTGEVIGDAIFELGGATLIAASYLLKRNEQ